MNECLIPFTQGPADISDLCFDIRKINDFAEYPIVQIPGELQETPSDLLTEKDLIRFRAFDSFSDYLDFIQSWLFYRTNFITEDFFSWLDRENKVKPGAYYRDSL